jgi:hypothetical protein
MAALFESNVTTKHQELSDVVTNVDRHECPLISGIKTGKDLESVIPSWGVEAYPDVNMTATPDGQDVQTFDSSTGELIEGVAEIVRRSPMVSKLTQNATNIAGTGGVKKAMAKQILIQLKMAKRDMESRICASDRELAIMGQNGATAHQTRSLGKYIQSGAQSLKAIPEAFRPAAAQINTTAVNSLTEADVKAVLKAIYEATGTSGNLKLIVGSDLQARIDTFGSYEAATERYTNRQYPAKVGEVVQMVKLLKTSFGTVSVELSNFLSKDTAHGSKRGFVLDMNMLELRYAQRPKFQSLEDRGGGPRGIIDAVFLLCVKNPKGLGKFAATALTA